MLFVKDNFITDSDLTAQILDDSSFFPEVMGGGNLGATLNEFHYEQADCYAPYMFWDGWQNSEVDTLKKRVIEKIWRNSEYLGFDEKDVAGFEYWTRSFSPGQWLGIHVDEDTFRYSAEKYFHGPAIGCVWYGFSEARGGYLEIHEKGLAEGENQLEREVVDALTSPIENRERIAYKPNRLVVFDAGHRLHETTPVIEGVKQVMVVNVWLKSSPPVALQTGEFFYE